MTHMNDAKHWRDRAAGMLMLSTVMKDDEARGIMVVEAAREAPQPHAGASATRLAQNPLFKI